MRSMIRVFCFGVAWLALSTASVRAEVLTASSILSAQKAGAHTDGIIAMVNDPANTVNVSSGDLVTLRDAGVSERVISALWARIPTAVPLGSRAVPDDARLVDLVRLINSGISESIVAEQVKQAGRPYELSVNDLLYLKENRVGESTMAALMATRTAAPAAPEKPGAIAAPAEISFDDLVLKTSFIKKDRPGRLVMRGDSLVWTDANDPEHNFEFKTTGLEKVWFTCEPRPPENFCHEINFKIVKGPHYQFQDRNREAGSNAAVLKVMAALRTYYPQLHYGRPKD